MKSEKILKILDLALVARNKGLVFNPMFEGDAGIAKSFYCQAWVKQQRETDPNFGFIDLRLANLEAPDLVGYPKVRQVDGQDRTSFILPEYWPTKGRGLLLLEEPNRANPSIMNAIMELLTDRKVQGYTLPEGWLIASAINQSDDGLYSVTAMDPALADRFERFKIEYDHASFIAFIKKEEWNTSLVSFIEKVWTYKKPSEIGDKGKYISPRTWSKVETALKCGVENDPDMLYTVAMAELGDAVGREFHKFMCEQTPVTISDLLANKEVAMAKLKGYCPVDNYRADLVSVTVDSVANAYDGKAFTFELVKEVATIIPADLALDLVKKVLVAHIEKIDDKYTFEAFLKDHKEFGTALKAKLTATEKPVKAKRAKKADKEV